MQRVSALELPEHLEAHEPPEARGFGRDDVALLVATRHDLALVHSRFRELPNFLSAGDLLVVNSGKSTLLKCLASIYRADAGTIRMAGRLAPFIELGVGFNMELTARENVVLNGVMMGLTKAETRRRLGSIIEFAELEEFVDLKLKNYSSGMLVRLAFSLMMHVDADVLLIDEVLAVGDAAFQQKCADAFHEMKAKGKTIVLVTHSMEIVGTYCDRAMLIDDGQVKLIGGPDEVGRQYLRLNFERDSSVAGRGARAESDQVRLLDIWTEGPSGARGAPIERGEEIVVGVELEFLRGPRRGRGRVPADERRRRRLLPVRDDDRGRGRDRPPVPAGSRARVRVRLDNPMVSGRYFLHLGVNRIGPRRRHRPLRQQRDRLHGLRRRAGRRHGHDRARDRSRARGWGGIVSGEAHPSRSCATSAGPRRWAAAGAASGTCSG